MMTRRNDYDRIEYSWVEDTTIPAWVIFLVGVTSGAALCCLTLGLMGMLR